MKGENERRKRDEITDMNKEECKINEKESVGKNEGEMGRKYLPKKFKVVNERRK